MECVIFFFHMENKYLWKKWTKRYSHRFLTFATNLTVCVLGDQKTVFMYKVLVRKMSPDSTK